MSETKRYEVCVSQTFYAFIEVETEDEDEARQLAYEQAEYADFEHKSGDYVVEAVKDMDAPEPQSLKA